jgi:hypothetical protein
MDLARHPEKAKATSKKLRPKDRPLANDFVSDSEFERLLRCWFGNIARVLLPGRGFYLWGGYANCGNYPPVLKAMGLYFSQAIIWVKEHPVLTRKDYMGNHEWCFYGWREGAAHQFYGPNNAVDVWSIKKVNPQSMVHLTEKPVELAKRALENSSRFGDNVLDLFGGSGSTLIAAELIGRRAFLMEPRQASAEQQRRRPMGRPRKNDTALLAALACGATAAAAARQVGVSERTVFRRLKDPAFCEQLKAQKAEIRQRHSDVLNASGLGAVKTLLRLQDESKPPTVQLGAARAVLEFGMRLHESVEFEQRLAALEERVREKDVA